MQSTLKVIHAATALILLTLSGCATSPHAARAWEYRVCEEEAALADCVGGSIGPGLTVGRNPAAESRVESRLDVI